VEDDVVATTVVDRVVVDRVVVDRVVVHRVVVHRREGKSCGVYKPAALEGEGRRVDDQGSA
jgi:hypothetical protein